MTLDPPIKLVIFDLDETLIEKFGGLYDDTIPILEFLKQNNICIALASYNQYADAYLCESNIIDFFDYVYFESWYEKLDYKYDMLTTILEKTKIPPNQVLFVDDWEKNIQVAQGLGIRTHLVEHGDKSIIYTLVGTRSSEIK